MEDLAKEYLNDSIDAFKNQDINLARKLMEDYNYQKIKGYPLY